MRMRKKKNLDVRFAACEPVLAHAPESCKGHWQDVFGNENPIHLEIGCGKGQFILGMAAKYPEINFIAIEKEEGALIMATEKAVEQNLPNLKFLSYDAALLENIFAPGEISRIYLNFSDPWPKNGQRKRRLTHSGFLKIYDTILAPYGQIHFKTDNQRLFEWTLAEICRYGLLMQNICLNLHASDFDNIQTEYEERFSAMGMPIYRLEAFRRGEIPEGSLKAEYREEELEPSATPTEEA